MIKLVLDTNVFVSGIFWSGPPYQILEAWQERKIKLIISEPILNEYIRVGNILSKKYNFDISAFIDLIAINSELYRPTFLKKQVSQDPDDDKFIECAISANCKLIISGDKDLLDISGFQDIAVLKPADFVKRYLK